jgi:hypothetical protein
MLEHLLAGFGNAIEGGLKGYSWAVEANERDEDRKRRDADRQRQIQKDADDKAYRERQEQRQARLDSDARNARGLDLMERDRKELERQQALQALRAELDKMRPDDPMRSVFAQAINADMAGVAGLAPILREHAEQQTLEGYHDTIEPTIADPEARAAYHANRHRSTLTADSFLTPEQRRRRELAEYEAKAGINARYPSNPPAPARPVPTDDAALPTGVRQYLATLKARHGDNYEALNREFMENWNQQVAAHPRIDATKVREHINSLFTADQVPRAGDSPFDRARRQGATPAPAAAAPAAPAPAAAAAPRAPVPVVGKGGQDVLLPSPTAPPEEQLATQLLARYRAATDPAVKADLRRQLEALRQQRRGG